VRAPDRDRPHRQQGGFFLIEAMVAILIFALGILGLVAMGGTAVSSQSDAQYRTEASSLANSIASEIALSITRTDEATKAATLAAFSHQPAPAPTTPGCVFDTSGAITANATTQGVVNLLNRAANLAAAPGMPGATNEQQQIFIDTVSGFNRVVITLCWRTASDSAWRRHTLVTYVN
jgi:type IV pilus assembly protein PilV